MNTEIIEGSILDTVTADRMKVAMVIVKVANKLGTDLPEGDRGYNLISEVIETLVKSGRLVAYGDISVWRNSEVRLPGL